MNKYNNGKIYIIKCKNNDNLIYVGSTIRSLQDRWRSHKNDSLRYSNILLYKTINGQWNDWVIELYQKWPCDSKEELVKQEGLIIRQLSTLNKKIEGRTRSEYYQENIEKLNQYKKEWYLKNCKRLIQKQKNYNIANKEKISEYKKIYYQNHKEKKSIIKIDNITTTFFSTTD
jgi:hypothetical protein